MRSLRLFLVSTFSMLCLFAFGQSFKYETIKIKQEVKAATPFSTPFKTLTVRIHGENHLKTYGILASEVIKNHLDFNLYENVDSEGDLHLDIFVKAPKFVGVNQKKKETEKDGKVTREFYYEGALATPMSYELRDGSRALIEEKVVYSLSDFSTFTTERRNSSRALQDYWDESKNIVITKKLTTALKKNIGTLADQLRDRYDDRILDASFNLFDVRKADKINAQFMNELFSSVQSAISTNSNMSEWDESKRQKLIDGYKKGLAFDAEDKKERVIYAASAYNLAALHLIWGDYESAQSFISQGRKADRKKYEFDKLQEVTKKSIERANQVDQAALSQWVASYVAGSDANLPALDDGNNQTMDQDDQNDLSAVGENTQELPVDTVVFVNDEMAIGRLTFDIYKGSGELAVAKIKKIILQPEGDEDAQDLDLKDIKLIRTTDAWLYPVEIAAGLKTTKYFFRPIQTSKDQNVGLLQGYYHPGMDLRYAQFDSMHLIVIKNGAKDGGPKLLQISGGLQFSMGINSGIKKNFEDCPAIVKKCENKQYVDSEYSLKSLIDDYDSCH